MRLPGSCKNKQFLQRGFGAAVLGGWSINGTFSHLSGLPFSITADSTSCNCPGNTQRPDQLVTKVKKVGRGVFGQAYFDPLAFSQVTTARFGNSSRNNLRGPGYTNADASLQRTFHVWERINVAIKLDAFNLTNTPHFGNPGANLASLTKNPDGSVKALNGYDQIITIVPLGRQIDQRYFRLSGQLTF
jgi:hypothetical protein